MKKIEMIFKIELNKYLRNYNLRIANEKDLNKIIELFKEVFNRNFGKNFWEWKYYKNPYGKIPPLVLYDGRKLIGSYSADFKKFLVDGIEVECALVTTAIVHSDYRSQGIFTYLAKNMYNKLRKMGIIFLYGFPNALYPYEIYIKKLKWNYCDKKTNLIKDINNNNKSPNLIPKSTTIEISKIDKYPNEINKLNNQLTGGGIFSKIDHEYLNWRYIEHPLNKYNNYLIYRNGEIYGYFVTKTYINNEGEKYGELDDFKIIDDNLTIFGNIYRFIHNYFIEKDHSYISTWVSDNSDFYQFLLKNSFKEIKMSISWGFKLLNRLDPKYLQLLLNPSNWDLRMGDSDAF